MADTPPPPLVDRLARNFTTTGGDLRELARTLVSAPEAWGEPRAKLKSPAEWIASALRAAGVLPPAPRILRALRALGQPLWAPPSPKGFADDMPAWVDGLSVRLNLAVTLGQMWAAERQDPRMLIEQALGPLASRETATTVARAESRQQAMTLLLMSPEFQRR